jgi:hypothetical protein
MPPVTAMMGNTERVTNVICHSEDKLIHIPATNIAK